MVRPFFRAGMELGGHLPGVHCGSPVSVILRFTALTAHFD